MKSLLLLFIIGVKVPLCARSGVLSVDENRESRSTVQPHAKHKKSKKTRKRVKQKSQKKKIDPLQEISEEGTTSYRFKSLPLSTELGISLFSAPYGEFDSTKKISDTGLAYGVEVRFPIGRPEQERRGRQYHFSFGVNGYYPLLALDSKGQATGGKVAAKLGLAMPFNMSRHGVRVVPGVELNASKLFYGRTSLFWTGLGLNVGSYFSLGSSKASLHTLHFQPFAGLSFYSMNVDEGDNEIECDRQRERDLCLDSHVYAFNDEMTLGFSGGVEGGYHYGIKGKNGEIYELSLMGRWEMTLFPELHTHKLQKTTEDGVLNEVIIALGFTYHPAP